MTVFTYDITQGMWLHRNDKLYKNQKSRTSTKKKEKLAYDIDTELQIGKKGLWKRDSDLITFNKTNIKSGTLAYRSNGYRVLTYYSKERIYN